MLRTAACFVVLTGAVTLLTLGLLELVDSATADGQRLAGLGVLAAAALLGMAITRERRP